MSSHQQTQLTTGNRIYLYRLLRNALGTGKQTFITQVDEALKADGLTAQGIGYRDTRELLEALEEFATLTVFKGGRVYVTLTAQATWDEALAAAENEPAKAAGAKGGKPWKRKRGARAIKPVRPRMIEPEVAPDSAPATEEDADTAASRSEETPSPAEETSGVESASGSAAETSPSTPKAQAASTDNQTDSPSPDTQAEGTGASSSTEASPAADAADATKAADAAGPNITEAADAPTAQRDDEPSAGSAETPAVPDPPSSSAEPKRTPAYSFTVTFDPDHTDAGVTTLASTPVAEGSQGGATPSAQETAPAGNPSQTTSPSPSPAARKHPANTAPTVAEATTPEAGHAMASASAEPVASMHLSTDGTASPAPSSSGPQAPAPAPSVDLGVYPQDFSTDVYCSACVMRELASLLPYGADALGIAGEYFYLACERGTADLGRGRASFPLRYLREGTRHTATVALKKRPHADPAWAIESVTIPEDER